MNDAPIGYGEAVDVMSLIMFHFEKAGPHTFAMTTQKYVKTCQDGKRVRALLQAIVDHKAKKSGAR